MKKWCYYGVIIACAACLWVGCSKTPVTSSSLSSWMEPQEKLKVLSTTAMIDDIVREIGGDDILHMTLIHGQLDPHSYELVKGDSEKLACADILFYNGLELEHGASLKYQLSKHPCAHALGDHLAQSEELIFIDHQVDPHIWMDVELFSHIIDPIVTVLSQHDPEHAEGFARRGEEMRCKMLVLDHTIYEKMQAIPSERRYLIASHDAFFYFARRYLSSPGEVTWKERFAAPEGLAPEGQISSKNIQAITHYAKAHQVSVIFPESNLNQDALKKIVGVLNGEGVKARLSKEPLYGDAMGDVGSSADSYLKMMNHNAEVINSSLLGGLHE